ncbi:unnamed protein product [Protopolystoma xenopodis]|uniref:Uncharacterized protein n=1 Tax=Protopolystoma xenopodis TaxID=117903 RepID=A0A448X650_9PLAT|nr:unnamed protein product [Protopolystoma xenopodis]
MEVQHRFLVVTARCAEAFLLQFPVRPIHKFYPIKSYLKMKCHVTLYLKLSLCEVVLGSDAAQSSSGLRSKRERVGKLARGDQKSTGFVST